MKGYAKAVAESLQVGGVCLVVYISHADMQCLDGEVGDVDFGATSKEFKQAQRVFATRQTDEDFIVLVDELELSQRFVECLPKSFVERHKRLFHKHQIDGTDNQEESQNMVPMQVSALEHNVGDDAEDGQRDALLDDL